jgi:hypothetical protein
MPARRRGPIWVPAAFALVSLAAVVAAVGALVGGTDDPPEAVGTVPATLAPVSTTAPPVVTRAPAPTSTVGVRSGRLEDLPAPASRPVRVRVAAPAIDAPVIEIGVDATAAMEVPEDVLVAGWYRFGPSPGEPGSAVVTAHVDNARQGRGAFFPMRGAQPGAVVTIDYADGSQRAFEVTGRRSYPKSTLPVEELFARSGPPVLTLITCGGSFDPVARRYDENVVVYAVPVDR